MDPSAREAADPVRTMRTTARVSVITRVVVALVVLLVVFSATLGYSIRVQRQLVRGLARINDGYVPMLRQLDELGRVVSTVAQVAAEDDPVALRQSLRASVRLFPYAERIEAQLAAVDERIAAIRETGLPASEVAFVDNVESLVSQLRVENREQQALMERLLGQLEAQAPESSRTQDELVRRLNGVADRVTDLTFLVEVQTDQAVADVQEAERLSVLRVVTVAAGAMLFALIVIFLTGRSLRPIRRLTAAAARMKEGDYVDESFESTNDEIGVLADEFAQMARAIRARDVELRRRNDELERAYERLIEAQRARLDAERMAAVGELSSRITHELRNPLSSIGLNVEMLGDDLRDAGLADTEVETMLTAIENEITRLTELTDEYLGLARGGRELMRSTVDVGVLADDVVAQLRGAAEVAGVSLLSRAEGDTLEVEADANQLRQVLINLLQNAIAILEETQAADRRVEVVTRSEAGDVVVVVEDSGPGIAEEVVATLFAPFVSTRSGGTGLGLNISKHIVEAHSGTIRAERSERLGGARFEVELPEAGALTVSGGRG